MGQTLATLPSGSTSTNRSLALSFGMAPIAVALLGVPAEEPSFRVSPVVDLIFHQTHQSVIATVQRALSVDEELRREAAGAFAALLAAQTDTDEDIAQVVGENRSSLYTLL